MTGHDDERMMHLSVYLTRGQIAMITDVLHERSEDQRLPAEDQRQASDAMYALKGARAVAAGGDD
jgi:hypothetical protein